MKHLKRIFLTCVILLFFSFFLTVLHQAWTLRKNAEVPPLTKSEKNALENVLDAQYENRTKIIMPLPYKTANANLELLAKSAIIVDEKSGYVLFEKNADEIIPPASMTKLFCMAVVFEKLHSGDISLDDVVPLPKECWACNMMPHSSLMFLGKNQIVTVKELLTGLAVASGNDAAYALAFYVSGSMENFISEMNDIASDLGLKKTHFVESSGYSEKNVTTAREMATFARYYIENFSESLHLFHSVLSFSYPKEHNLSPEDKGKPRTQDFSEGIPEHITMEIYQKNTNQLLGTLQGCDGLKTGYIEESGYNFCMTVVRGNMRILSVTMDGPGENAIEGNAGRFEDGKKIAEWAFDTFFDYENSSVLRSYSIPLLYAKNRRINLVPAFSIKNLPVPFVATENRENANEEIKTKVNLPQKIPADFESGTEFGNIEYSINDHLLQTIPLVSSRAETKQNFWLVAADFFAQVAVEF